MDHISVAIQLTHLECRAVIESITHHDTCS